MIPAPAILAIDPGTTESAYVLLVDGKIDRFAKLPNADMLKMIEWVKWNC